MRNITRLKETDNSREYRLLQRNEFTSCPICPPNKGCNGGYTRFHDKSWKKFRKYQWKH